MTKKIIIMITVVLVLLIGGGIAIAINTPTARADRQLNLGNKYLQEGKYQEAILAFQKVIEIEQKNIPARLGLGKAYIATSEFAKAETVLKEVIGIDPNNIPAREELFKVYIKEGELDAANSILKEISTIDPQKDMNQYNSDLDLAKAISVSQVSYDLGIKQMNDKQYSEAVESFQKVIKEDTERYADAQTKSSDCKKAYVTNCIQTASDLAKENKYTEAIKILKDSLKIDENNQDVKNLIEQYNQAISKITVTQQSETDNQMIIAINKAIDHIFDINNISEKRRAQMNQSGQGHISHFPPTSNDVAQVLTIKGIQYLLYPLMFTSGPSADYCINLKTYAVYKASDVCSGKVPLNPI